MLRQTKITIHFLDHIRKIIHPQSTKCCISEVSAHDSYLGGLGFYSKILIHKFSLTGYDPLFEQGLEETVNIIWGMGICSH
jgi:hypothetical protein